MITSGIGYKKCENSKKNLAHHTLQNFSSKRKIFLQIELSGPSAHKLKKPPFVNLSQ